MPTRRRNEVPASDAKVDVRDRGTWVATLLTRASTIAAIKFLIQPDMYAADCVGYHLPCGLQAAQAEKAANLKIESLIVGENALPGESRQLAPLVRSEDPFMMLLSHESR